MRHQVRWLIFLLTLLPWHSVLSAEYRLFTAPGVPASDYSAIVPQLRSGDVIVLGDGSRKELGTALGTGSTTRVFSIGEGKVARLALHQTQIPELDAFLNTHEFLERTGLPVPKLFRDESRPHEIAIVEDVGPHFSLSLFNDAKDFKAKGYSLSPEEKAKVEDDLVAFARKSIHLRSVGDQHDGQVVYTKRGWMLLDWSNDHARAVRVNDADLFRPDLAMAMADNYKATQDTSGMMFRGNERLSVPPGLHKRVYDAIREERVRAGFVPPFSCQVFLKNLAGRWFPRR